MSDEAHAAIAEYCELHGVSMTAWMEAVGRRMSTVTSASADPALQEAADETLRLARQIDADRRSRRPAG